MRPCSRSAHHAGAEATLVSVSAWSMGTHRNASARSHAAHHRSFRARDPGIFASYFEMDRADLGDVTIVCTTRDLGKFGRGVSHMATRASCVKPPAYPELFLPNQASWFASGAELVQRTGGQRRDTNAVAGGAESWNRDVFANIEGAVRDCPTFLALAGKYRGVPALNRRAGPSLVRTASISRRRREEGHRHCSQLHARALRQLRTHGVYGRS